MKYFLVFICSLILISGCTSIPSSQPSKKTFIETMMKSDKCKNTCWLGIEPGMQIEPQNAFVILGNYYGSENVYYPEIGPSVGWITYDKNLSPLFLEKGYIAYTDDNVIGLITVMFQNNQIPIEDLVAVFGKPEITTIQNRTIPCGLKRLLYPKIGLAVFIDNGSETDYIGMMSVDKPFSVNNDNFDGKDADKEIIINWDEREKSCPHTTPSSP